MAELASRARTGFGIGAILALAGCTTDIQGHTPAGGLAGTTSVSGSAGAAGTTGGASGAGGMGSAGNAGSSGSAGTAGTGTVTPPAPANPGVVTVRRLNRVEYNNTVRDLLGTSLRPADRFQADTPGDGFDTVGAAASLSPAAARDYEEAAYALVDELLADTERIHTVITCEVATQGEPCAKTIVSALARRAFRRPVSDAEVEGLLAPYRDGAALGATPSLRLRYTLAGVLISERFLFRLEFDPDLASSAPHRLTPHELATRLSYTLWSSMPDGELFAAADTGALAGEEELRRQVERMLTDPRAGALAQNFAGQWLRFRDLELHEVDARAFPSFGPALAGSMKREAELYVSDFLRSERPLRELLSARFTYLDETLASHYGMSLGTGTTSGDMWLADTTSVPRRGLLTLGAVLTATSFSARTSPVKRGEFVLKQLLCETITPPPPDVQGLPDEPETGTSGLTLRQRLEQHRANPMCLGCHMEMDPIGFGLETYDAIGRYRTTDNGLPVDSTGELTDGTRFSGALELAEILSSDPRFERCVTKNLMVFALGRYVDQTDDTAWIAHLTGTARDLGGELGALVRTLVLSESFRSKQAVSP